MKKSLDLTIYYPYDITIMRASLKGFALKFFIRKEAWSDGKN